MFTGLGVADKRQRKTKLRVVAVSRHVREPARTRIELGIAGGMTVSLVRRNHILSAGINNLRVRPGRVAIRKIAVVAIDENLDAVVLPGLSVFRTRLDRVRRNIVIENLHTNIEHAIHHTGIEVGTQIGVALRLFATAQIRAFDPVVAFLDVFLGDNPEFPARTTGLRPFGVINDTIDDGCHIHWKRDLGVVQRRVRCEGGKSEDARKKYARNGLVTEPGINQVSKRANRTGFQSRSRAKVATKLKKSFFRGANPRSRSRLPVLTWRRDNSGERAGCVLFAHDACWAMKLLVLRTLVATVCVLGWAPGQEIRLRPSTLQPVVGQAFTIQLTVEGGKHEKPSLLVDGLDIRYAGHSQNVGVTFSNGKMERHSASLHTFKAVPRREGTFVIPAITMAVGGKQLRTEPVELTVLKQPPAQPGQAKLAFIKVEPLRDKLYVGETMPVKVKLYLHSSVRLRRLRNQREIQLRGESLIFQEIDRPKEDIETIGGTGYQVYVFETAVTAVKPGNHEIEPFTIQAQVTLPRKGNNQPRRPRSILEEMMGRDPFEGIFDDGFSSENIDVQIGATPLEVVPLPEQGMPEDFKGAIGKFDLQVNADRTDLKVDEALTLTASLRGSGNFDRILEIPAQSGSVWKAYSQSSDFTPEDRLGMRGEKRFTQVFMPLQATTEGPEFKFSYFDPETEKYVKLRKKPVYVKVTGNTNPTATPAEGNTVAPESSSSTRASGIGTLRPPPSKWHRRPARSLWDHPVFWLINGTGTFVAVVGLALLLLRKRSIVKPEIAERKRYASERRRLRFALERSKEANQEFQDNAISYLELVGSKRLGRPKLAAEVVETMPKPQRGILMKVVRAVEGRRWSGGLDSTVPDTNADEVRQALFTWDPES